MKCTRCGHELLPAVALTAMLGGPRVCGHCIDVRSEGGRPMTTKRSAFVIENTINGRFWREDRWVEFRTNAQAFPTYEEAEAVLLRHGLDKVLGAEVVEYLIELLVVRGRKRRK